MWSIRLGDRDLVPFFHMNSVKATFFDLDGTLLHYTRDYDEILRETFIDVCGNCETSWIEDYSNCFFENFANFNPKPYRKAFQELNVERSASTLVDTLLENEISMCEKPNGCDEYLNSVSDEQKLGVLTNGVSDWQRQKIERFNLTEYFDSTVVSYDVGIHKPEKDIFEYAEASVPATEFEMIGDSKEHDVDGALNAGWNAREYNKEGFDSFFQ